jgi:hypothetical protein
MNDEWRRKCTSAPVHKCSSGEGERGNGKGQNEKGGEGSSGGVRTVQKSECRNQSAELPEKKTAKDAKNAKRSGGSLTIKTRSHEEDPENSEVRMQKPEFRVADADKEFYHKDTKAR